MKVWERGKGGKGVGEIAMVVAAAAQVGERRKDDESRRREGARTFSLRGLRNLRLRACRSSERCGNDLLDPLSLSRGAAARETRSPSSTSSAPVVIVQVHPTPKQDGHVSSRSPPPPLPPSRDRRSFR